jgi:SRSO17 transposase
LSSDKAQELPESLRKCSERYRECFQTKTRNDGQYTYPYLSGLLRMETQRNYTNIGQATGASGETIQHFMSKSPWSGQAVMKQIQDELKATPSLEQGGVVILDESANKKAGDKSAGASRQHNGRLGKIDMSQVGTMLAYANLTRVKRPVWTWVDGELYLPEDWFRPEKAKDRQRAGIPPERVFETKIELGWKMIERAQANGLPFKSVAFDDFYGQSAWLRDKVAGAGLIYMADVPCSTAVYLDQPVLGVPAPTPGRRGRRPTRVQVLNGVKSIQVRDVARRDDMRWRRIRVRPIERGELHDPFAARRVWTLRDDQTEPVEEWLLIRQESPHRCSYALSNAPATTPLKDLAWLKCQRYFVERCNQDAKSGTGWDELQARKYRGWEHHLALVTLATWFVAQIKMDWAHRCIRDPRLAQQFEVNVLPALSMANIRALLRSALPLPQPSTQEAVVRAAQHLVNRTRSRKSRLKRQRSLEGANAPP